MTYLADAQAEIARLTRENENLRQIERNVQAAREHEHQLAERALAAMVADRDDANSHWEHQLNRAHIAEIKLDEARAELARLREQMKDRLYD